MKTCVITAFGPTFPAKFRCLFFTSTGDVDYFFNGGLVQPGCEKAPVKEVIDKIKSPVDLAEFPVEGRCRCSIRRRTMKGVFKINWAEL